MLWHDVTAGICALQVMCRTECLIPPDIPSALSARMAYMRLAQALSPEGRCKSFDASGNGYGRGEGVNALVLRNCASEGRRPAATALAVVQGSAVNQDGRSSSLTAPNGPAQQVHELHELQTFVAGWLRTMLLTRLPRPALAGTAGDGTNIRRARCLRRVLYGSTRHRHAIGRSNRDWRFGSRSDVALRAWPGHRLCQSGPLCQILLQVK